MLDLRLIRSETERVRRGLEAKNAAQSMDRLLPLDEERREILQQVESKKAERNRSSQEIGRLKGQGNDTTLLQDEMKALSDEIKAFDVRVRALDTEIETLLSWLPNLPHESVPIGPDASANVEVRRWGSLPPDTFRPLPHWEIGERLGLLDFKRAAKLSGAGFVVFTGRGARLERALIQFMLDLHTRSHGFLEVSTPFIVRRDCMFGTGQLPKMEEDMYRCEVDDLFLIPTAEVSITNLFQGEENLQESELPISLVGYSPCFRREAGAYGKDTRGLIRLHQFDKVEMVRIVAPETSYDQLESLTGCAEAVLKALELPYRVLSLASGDLSFAAAKCYDLETWGPAEGRWLEVSSCSNFEAFQARRIGIRYRTRQGKLEYPHTLNGSGLALPRVMVALLEMHQTSQGTVRLPEALRPYMDGMEELTPEPGR